MTIAQYQKLSKRQMFEWHRLKQILALAYINEDLEEISFETPSYKIMLEYSKLNITTDDKTILQIWKSLMAIKIDYALIVDDINETGKETLKLNRLQFLKNHTIFLVFNLMDYDLKKLPPAFKETIKEYSDNIEFIKELKI